MNGVSRDFRTNITITFSSNGRSTPASLHELVRDMGIQIEEKSMTGLPSTNPEPPFATVGGESSQPALHIVWSLVPDHKVTMQLNGKKRTLTVKGKRGSIEFQRDRLLTFLGQPMWVKSSAPAGSRKAPALTSQVNIRELLVARQG